MAPAGIRGATNREAASALFLSAKTVEFHLGHVYHKLGVRNRTELAHQYLALED
ncbi:response regulator transcription factor [Streptomyces sp. WM6386]|uniref:response regulator transcription factor n=1 Tax=Streptomyces sp. WM6386 TaxID=1415558 RepID=UPI001F3BC698|nr:helix-turn-helix transcriptional regulator [Streptomyces sp. WM6386]